MIFDIGVDMMRGRPSSPREGDHSQDGAPNLIDGAPQHTPIDNGYDDSDSDDDGWHQNPKNARLSPMTEDDVEEVDIGFLLPESTLDQQQAMSDFVKAPSRDKWLDLVEKMRLQREEQITQMGHLHNIPNDVRPDPEEEITFHDENDKEDMGGWTMRASGDKKEKMNGSSYEEDEEVSQQLKSMLNNAFTYNAYARAGMFDDNARAGKGRRREKEKPLNISRRMMIVIFILGFILGSIVIISVSFYFDRSPREELNILSTGLRGQDGQDNTNNNNTSDITAIDQATQDDQSSETPESSIKQEEVDFLVEQDLKEIANFCGHCRWKTATFNCYERVKWEMDTYQLTELEAKMANIKHCEKTSPTCKYAGDDCS